MQFKDNINYTILSNKIDTNLMTNFLEYQVIEDNVDYEELQEIISNFTKKTIVFKEVFRKLSNSRKKKILDLLKIRKINFINITSNIEEALYSDYIIVYDKELLVMEGSKEGVLKEEKILKRIGFGLPFVVDLSVQLKLYKVLDKVYFDMESLVKDLWN